MKARSIKETIEFQRGNSPKQSIGVGSNAINKEVSKEIISHRTDIIDEFEQRQSMALIQIAEYILRENVDLGEATMEILELSGWFDAPDMDAKEEYIDFLGILEEMGFILPESMLDILNSPEKYLNENTEFKRNQSVKRTLDIGEIGINKQKAHYIIQNRDELSYEYDSGMLDVLVFLAYGIASGEDNIGNAIEDAMDTFNSLNDGTQQKEFYIDLLAALNDIGFILPEKADDDLRNMDEYLKESIDFKRGGDVKSTIGIGEFSDVEPEYRGEVIKLDRILKEKGFIKAPDEEKERLFPADIYTWVVEDEGDYFVHASLFKIGIGEKDKPFNLYIETERRGRTIVDFDKENIHNIIDKTFYDEGYVNESINFQRGQKAKETLNIGSPLYKGVSKLDHILKQYGFNEITKSIKDLHIGRYEDSEVGAVWAKRTEKGLHRFIIVNLDFDWYSSNKYYDTDNDIEVRYDFTDLQAGTRIELNYLDKVLEPGFILVNFEGVEDEGLNESLEFNRGRTVKDSLEVGNEWIIDRIVNIAEEFGFEEISNWDFDNIEGYHARYFENEDEFANLTLYIPDSKGDSFIIPRSQGILNDIGGETRIPAIDFTDEKFWISLFDLN